MDTVSTLLKQLKKKRYIDDIDKAKNEVMTKQIPLRKPDDLFIRDAITGIGTILLEDLENHYYIITVKVGAFNNALTQVIIYRNGNSAEIAVYAHEGLIKQNLSEKAMDKVKKALS